MLLPLFYILAVPPNNLGSPGKQASAGGERRVTFLAINDIYRLDGLADGTIGGLTRVRTLRKWIERDAPNAILLHAGDFLSPSLISKVFKGEQMIDALNNLDGDPKAFDRRMFVAFGNHEFDDSRCQDAQPPLNARVDESQFTWLAANLDFPNCKAMSGILSRKNVHKDGFVLDVDNVKVGLFGIGLTPDKRGAPRYPQFEKALPAARRSIDYLRAQGAELIVALTHLPREDDEALITELSGAGLDLVVGGHDHENMVLRDGRGFKADSDARSAWRIDVHLSRGQKPRIEGQLILLNAAIPPDAALEKLAESWFARTEKVLCEKMVAADAHCLGQPVGWIRSMMELEETPNRSQETGFGDWLGDLVLSKTRADVALINSGNLGLNENLPSGSKLTLKHVIDIFRFDDVIAVRSFPARQVCAAITHGLQQAGTGAWPHLAGVEAAVTRRNNTQAAAVTRFIGKDGVTCDSETPIKVAALPYILCGGDDYPFLPGGASKECIEGLQKMPTDPADPDYRGELLSKMAGDAIRAAQATGLELINRRRLRFAE